MLSSQPKKILPNPEKGDLVTSPGQALPREDWPPRNLLEGLFPQRQKDSHLLQTHMDSPGFRSPTWLTWEKLHSCWCSWPRHWRTGSPTARRRPPASSYQQGRPGEERIEGWAWCTSANHITCCFPGLLHRLTPLPGIHTHACTHIHSVPYVVKSCSVERSCPPWNLPDPCPALPEAQSFHVPWSHNPIFSPQPTT